MAEMSIDLPSLLTLLAGATLVALAWGIRES